MWEILNNDDKQIPIPQKGRATNNLEIKIINIEHLKTSEFCGLKSILLS